MFLDRQCTKPFPLRLPPAPNVHRIITCRGAAKNWLEAFGGPGSLMVTNESTEYAATHPFTLGSVDDGKFYHVFDEVAVDVLLGTLDTASDFCRYLRRREALFAKYRVFAAGEEELLGYYMWHTGSDGHDFVIKQDVASVALSEGFWMDWLRSPQRAAYDQANEPSYFSGSPDRKGLHPHAEWHQPIRDTGRCSRNRISSSLDGTRAEGAKADAGDGRSWYVGYHQARTNPTEALPADVTWRSLLGLLVIPQPPFGTYDEYREVRHHMLIEHCAVAKHLHPDAQDVVGLALEATRSGTSEDGVYLDARDWSVEMAEHAKATYNEHGYFAAASRNPSIRA